MLDEYLDGVLSVCAREFGVSVQDVKSGSKKQELVYCRKAFCAVVRETLDVKLEETAKRLCRSVNAVARYSVSQPDNKYYAACLNRIRAQVGQYPPARSLPKP